MPCYVPPGAYEGEADPHNSVGAEHLCTVLKLLERNNLMMILQSHTEILEWWKDHKIRDRNK